jgi:hypothetical protein
MYSLCLLFFFKRIQNISQNNASGFTARVPKEKNGTQISVREMLMYDFQLTLPELHIGFR